MTKLMQAAAALLLLAAGWMASEANHALQDRQQFPSSEWPNIYYISTSAADGKSQGDQVTALRLILPSVSRQPILERCSPVEVSPTLYRIDLRDMQWDQRTWLDLVARHPYSASHNSLVLRADWLLLQLTDAQESDSYYRLIWGGKAPKTRDEALAGLGVDSTEGLRFGLIEGQSGVSLSRVRWLENRPISRGYCWGTRDSVTIDDANDPLEHLQGNFVNDGEEWITGIRKIHLATGTQGTLQVYFLATGAGKVIARAPVDLVQDRTEFRGLREIRNPGSCIQCHDNGLNLPTTNELRRLITDGVDVYADKPGQESIESFHLADVSKELDRSREDFQAIVKLATGVESPEAVAAYQRSIQSYDQPLDLAQCALELGVDHEELRLALGLASATGDQLGARLADLAHGGTIPRAAWEDKYLLAKAFIQKWRSK